MNRCIQQYCLNARERRNGERNGESGKKGNGEGKIYFA